MSLVFRAEDEPVRSRLEYWRHIVAGTLGPLELTAPEDPDFRDELLVGQLGAVHVGDLFVHQPGQGRRTARHVRRSDHDMFQVGVQTRGQTVVEQAGRQVHLAPGDLTFVDLSRPCRWLTGPAQVTMVVLPRELLPLPADDLQRTTGMHIPIARPCTNGASASRASVQARAAPLTAPPGALSGGDGPCPRSGLRV
jgi:AraC-binding-like domain